MHLSAPFWWSRRRRRYGGAVPRDELSRRLRSVDLSSIASSSMWGVVIGIAGASLALAVIHQAVEAVKPTEQPPKQGQLPSGTGQKPPAGERPCGSTSTLQGCTHRRSDLAAARPPARPPVSCSPCPPQTASSGPPSGSLLQPRRLWPRRGECCASENHAAPGSGSERRRWWQPTGFLPRPPGRWQAACAASADRCTPWQRQRWQRHEW